MKEEFIFQEMRKEIDELCDCVFFVFFVFYKTSFHHLFKQDSIFISFTIQKIWKILYNIIQWINHMVQ